MSDIRTCRKGPGTVGALVSGLVAIALLLASAPGWTQPEASGSATSPPQPLQELDDLPLGQLVQDVRWEKRTFQSVLEEGLRRAPRIENARAELQRGDAAIEGAEIPLPYEPSLNIGVEQFPFEETPSGEVKIGLVQRIQIAGERGERVEAAEATKRTLNRRLKEAQWRVHVELHRLYNLARVDLRRLRLASKLRRFSEDLLGIATTRSEAGEASDIAVHVAKAEVAKSRERELEARRQLVSRLQAIRETAGLEDSSALPLPSETLPARTSAPPSEELVEAARQTSPAVRTQEAAIEAARAQLELEERRVWPDPTVGLFYKRKSPSPGESANGFVAQVSLPLPLWDRNRASRAMASAEITVAEKKLQSLRRKLDAQIEDARQRLQRAKEQIDIYGDRVLPSFRRQLDLLREGYREGEFDITDLTVAEKRLLTARERYLQALEDYYRAAGDIESLVGREFWKSESNDGGSRR